MISTLFANLDRIVLVRDGLLTLDMPAAALSDAHQALLTETIGLPFGLRAAQALELTNDDPLNSLMTQGAPQLWT